MANVSEIRSKNGRTGARPTYSTRPAPAYNFEQCDKFGNSPPILPSSSRTTRLPTTVYHRSATGRTEGCAIARLRSMGAYAQHIPWRAQRGPVCKKYGAQSIPADGQSRPHYLQLAGRTSSSGRLPGRGLGMWRPRATAARIGYVSILDRVLALRCAPLVLTTL